MGTAWKLIKQTFADWLEDKAPRLGAALAYYAIFSIPPLVLLVTNALGYIYHGDTGGVLARQAKLMLGETTGQSLLQTLQAQGGNSAVSPGVFGVALLLFGASGLFGQLQDAMNTIWEVQPKQGRGLLGIVQDRFLSFTMVLGTAFLLLTSLLLTAAIAAVAHWLPSGEALGHILENAISLVVITFLFAMIFKILPDVEIAWADVWIGAMATAVLFLIGKILIGLYLGRASLGSSYGAAAPIIILLVWVYYSAQILFLGAEFTQVYANAYGSRVMPAKNAEPVTEEKRGQEGMQPQLKQGEKGR
jgi:membrane protein